MLRAGMEADYLNRITFMQMTSQSKQEALTQQ